MKKCKKFIFILSVMILVSVFSLHSEAKERRKVTVLFPTMKDSLLYVVNEDGSLGGMMSEYFDALEKCTGWDIEYVTGDMEELYEQFLAGEIDIMGTTSYTEELEKYADYPMIPSGTDHIALAAKDDSGELVLGDITSINDKTVAVTARQQASGKVEALKDFCGKSGVSVKIKVYETSAEYLKSIDKGEADLIMVGSMAKPVEMWEVLHFEERPYYTIVSEGKKEILSELNTALYTMHKMTTDYGDTLYRKYFSKDNLNLSYAFTEEERAYLKEKKVLKAAIVKQFTKEETVNGKKQYNSFMVDVGQYFARLIGVDLEFVLADGQSGVEEALRSGEADFAPALMTIGSSRKPEGVDLIAYSDVEQVMVTNLEEASHKKILAVTPSQYNKISLQDRRLKGYKEYLTYDTVEECIDSVFRGDATAACMDMFTAQYYIIHKGYSNLSTILLGQSSGELNIGLSDNCDAELLTILKKVNLYCDEDEIYQVVIQNVINQKSQVTVMNFVRQHMEVIVSTLFVGTCLILTCIFWAIYSRMKQQSAEEAVKEREKNEQRLSEALVKANAATEAKSRFLSTVSHEMRTPLNGITGMLTLIKTDEMSPEGKEQLRQARAAANHMMTLVSDVLDMSKIENREEQLNKEVFEIGALLEQTKEILLMQTEGKDIQLNIIDETPPRQIWGDASKVRQMLLNIVGNSIKFLQGKGEAGIRVRQIPSADDGKLWYEFYCWDNGPGISTDYKKDMFKPFTRAKEVEERQIRGTGLGLSIVKGIVDLFKGNIDFCEREGDGVCFCIQLPFEEVPDGIETEDKVETEAVDIKEVLTGKRVLVAEDNELNSQIMIEFLKVLGVDSEAAGDGEEAVAKYAEKPSGYYDAILMDIQMPRCSGYQAAEYIRKSGKEDAGRIPIIATTANAFLEDIQKSKDAGMNGHLAKPINLEMLTKVLIRHTR